MDSLYNSFQNIMDGLSLVLRVGSVFLALLLCFTGYRMVRQWIAFIAFIFGAILGYTGASSAGLGKDYWYLPVIIALVSGIILSLLGYKIFQFGLFVFSGAVVSWAVTVHILPESMAQADAGTLFYGTTILRVLIFVAGGILAVRFARTAIILISAVGGARIASAGLAQLLPKYFPDNTRQLQLFAGLAAAGILIQFLTTKRDTRKRRAYRD